jgi:glutathione S-transferase
MQVPWLVDPNGGRELFESADIVAYLDAEYAVSP